MRKLKGFLIVLFAVILFMSVLAGCAGIQGQIAKFDDQNATNTVATGKQIMKHWGMNSKAIHIGIGDAVIGTKLPAEFGSSLKALDDLCVKFCPDQTIMTEADATETVMYLGKLIAPTIETLINQYAPDIWSKVMKYIPAFVTF
jgi:hypothetical protein